MKYKKYFSLFICVVMLLAVFAACDGGAESGDPIVSAMAKGKSTRYKITETKTIDVLAVGGEASKHAGTEFVENMFEDGVTEMYFDGNNSMIVDEDGVTTIYADGTYYFNGSGIKFKQKMDISELEMIGAEALAESGIKDLSAFTTVETVDNADGSKTITGTGIAAADKATEALLGSALANMVQYDNAAIKYVFTIDAEGRFSKIEITLPMTVSVPMFNDDGTPAGGTAVSISITSYSVSEFDYSAGIEIKAPADASEYIEMDIGDIID